MPSMKKNITKSGKPSFYNLNSEDLKLVLRENGLSPFVAKQLFDWVYKKKIIDMEAWSNIGKKVKEYLFEAYDFSLPEIIWHGLSKDGTRKYLCKMADGQTV